MIAATYRAARAALVKTRKQGEWMNSLKELQDTDIRGISEWVLKEKEKEDWRLAQEQSGLGADAIDKVLNKRNVPTIPFNPILSLGQSKQVLSWIW
ncbi:hypothetical protein E1B28_013363 [Marasmius oreades]|uniref:Uncharacterized protein n=1 Tax=Marasmius oreades TaxID=181124 RepID=A0A9P7UM15_9AGAR|nr:uncharacterized protein E1B28_013363 [Marasmius oreades]KAG7087392.1 hypothetical protein E1B28_013363 [Marasmius oreades]